MTERLPDAANGNAGERGFALVTAVSVLVVLAMVATGLSMSVRQEIDMARNFRDAAVAGARTEAGIFIAIESLLSRDPVDRWPVDGRDRVLAFDGARIRVTLQDEAGKIDLNWAPLQLIDGLLAELNVDPALQTTIDGEILARRRSVRMPATPSGEIMGGVLAAGPRLHDIATKPFGSVDALLTLPGMTRETYDRIRPFVTVYAESGHISLPVAPREVLLSVPGMTPRDAELIIAARQRDPAKTGMLPPLSAIERAQPFVAALDTRSVTVTAETTTPSGGRVTRQAVIALTNKPYQPIRFLEWRQDF